MDPKDQSLSTDQGVVTVAVDSGGTFTDCLVRVDGAYQRHFKIPSTPNAPEIAVLEAIERVDASGSIICRHGTTVGTNGLLERRGANVVLITTEGFEDTLVLGRQARPDVYALEPARPSPIVNRNAVIGCPYRITADGQRLGDEPNWSAFVHQHSDQLRNADAIAIALLHATRYPQDEMSLAEVIRKQVPNTPLSISSCLSALQREYERMNTACVNAYLQPLVSRVPR